MPVTVSPIIVTPDLDRLRTFYAALLDATEVRLHPEEGPVFFVGLRFGEAAELGLIADADVQAGSPGRVALSIDVADVDARVERYAC